MPLQRIGMATDVQAIGMNLREWLDVGTAICCHLQLLAAFGRDSGRVVPGFAAEQPLLYDIFVQLPGFAAEQPPLYDIFVQHPGFAAEQPLLYDIFVQLPGFAAE